MKNVCKITQKASNLLFILNNDLFRLASGSLVAGVNGEWGDISFSRFK